MWRAIGIALLLAGCGLGTPDAPPPGNIAERTTLDEAAALQVENVYISTTTVILAANRYGLVPASAWPAIGKANRRAYAAVKAVRAAYEAGNADRYAIALVEARDAARLLMEAFKA